MNTYLLKTEINGKIESSEILVNADPGDANIRFGEEVGRFASQLLSEWGTLDGTRISFTDNAEVGGPGNDDPYRCSAEFSEGGEGEPVVIILQEV